MLLEKIECENDIQNIPVDQYPELAKEIRSFLIESLSQTGGHLASNLGVVELTMALHTILHFPEDKLIWDVGHQSYTHKLLTGRKNQFATLRQHGGLSGFPKRSESDCDAMDTGHSTTSISAGVGYVQARDLRHESYCVVSVIGDGSLTGGMAYEALNNAAELKTNYIIVLNDNKMSISENVGGMSAYLSNIRTAEAYTGLKMGVTTALNKVPVVGEKVVGGLRSTKRSIKQLMIPGMYFEDMGITYLGPVDGHNCRKMIKTFREAKRVKGPVLVHVVTEKGRGYTPAKRHPARFHGTAPFDVATGLPVQPSGKAQYTDVFSTIMRKFGDRYPDLVAVSAAMPDGTGLKRFRNMFPDRFFDVGIAEEHAVTFAAGLALGGLTPVVAIYSTFLQRAYDQLMIDICMQNLHVIFAVDRAGIVGCDGETHQGCFDLSYLSTMPNMKILAPKNKWELSDMMKYAVSCRGPVAIRYPRGEAYDGLEQCRSAIIEGRSEQIHIGGHIAVFAVGSMVAEAEKAYQALRAEGIDFTLVNVRFVKPLDEKLILEMTDAYDTIITMEENVRNGGFGERVLDLIASKDKSCRVKILALPDKFVEHGSMAELRHLYRIDDEALAETIREETRG